LGIGCQLCLGDLLYRDKAKRALDELLSTAREHQPLFLCSCVRDPRRRNESRISLTEQLRAGARYLDLRVEWNKNKKQTQLPVRDPDYYLYHGDFVSDNKWSSVVDQIERFLRENQREILILYVRLYPREGQDEKTERLKVWDPLLKRFPNQLADQDFVFTSMGVHDHGGG
jgi:hypothetical protein